jgi:hypothetical protein
MKFAHRSLENKKKKNNQGTLEYHIAIIWVPNSNRYTLQFRCAFRYHLEDGQSYFYDADYHNINSLLCMTRAEYIALTARVADNSDAARLAALALAARQSLAAADAALAASAGDAAARLNDRTTPGGAQLDKLGSGPYMMTPVLDTG